MRCIKLIFTDNNTPKLIFFSYDKLKKRGFLNSLFHIKLKQFKPENRIGKIYPGRECYSGKDMDREGGWVRTA